MAKAGVLTIDVSAGTAQFVVDMDRANGKLRDFGRSADDAGSHTVSSMQSSSAAIRLLENPLGNNIRAVERFITLLPGLSGALQTAFPIIGAIAFADLLFRLGEEVGKLTGWWGPVSEAEKKATEEAQRLDQTVQSIGRHIQQIDLDSFRIKFGQLAAKGKEAADAAARVAGGQGKGGTAAIGAILAHNAQLVKQITDAQSALHAPGLASGAAQVLGKQAGEASAQLAANLAALKVLYAQGEEAKKESNLKHEQLGVDELDDTVKKNNTITEENERATAAARKAFEDKSHLAEAISQSGKEGLSELLRQGAQEGEILRRNLEQEKRFTEEQAKLQTEAVKKAAELAAELAKASQVTAGGNTRVGEINAKGAGESADLNIQAQKLAAERAYGLQITTTLKERIAYMTQIAQLDRDATNAKIAGLQAERAIALAQSADAAAREAGEQLLGKGGVAEAEEAARALEKVAELTQQINAMEREGANRQYAAGTGIAQTQKENSLGQDAKQVTGPLANALATGIMNGGKGIGKDVTESLKGVGKQLLGDVLKKSLDQMVAAILGQTVATNLNTYWLAIKAFLGFASGGNPDPSRPFIAGENGPELIHPKGMALSVMPNGQTNRLMNRGYSGGGSSGGGSSPISIGSLHFHAHDIDSPQQHLDMVARGLPDLIKTLSPRSAAFAV